MFSSYGVQGPTRQVVEKWFQRGAVPGRWLAVLLALLELESGASVSVAKYLEMGGDE